MADTKEENKMVFLAIPSVTHPVRSTMCIAQTLPALQGRKKDELKVGHRGWLLIDGE